MRWRVTQSRRTRSRDAPIGTWLAGTSATMGTRRQVLLILLALGGFVSPGLAQTFTWTGTQNANWSVGNNWAGGVAPAGTGAENLVFPAGAANLLTNNTTNNGSFNSVTIKGTGYTLGNKAITLGAGGLADSSAAGSNTISLGITFAATRTVTVSNAATTLTISGVITGAGGLTKSGAGTLVLSAANTYTGVTTINAGTISIPTDAALGTPPGAATPGRIVFAGGTLRSTATFALAANRGISLSGAGTISTDPATTLTYGGIIAGPGGLTKAGTGTLLVSGLSTYTGATAISAGTLRLSATNAIGSTSAVTVTAGATFDLGGFSDVVGSLAGAGTVTSSAPGTVTLSAGGNNSSTAFTGVIQDGSGQVGLPVTGTVSLSGATLSGTMGFTPPTGSTFTIVNNDGSDAVVGTFAGLAEGSTVVLSGQAFKISYVGGTGNDVVLSVAKPNLTMGNSVVPPGTSPPGTDLTYTLSVTNNGGDNATSVVVVDTLAPTVQFKVGR